MGRTRNFDAQEGFRDCEYIWAAWNEEKRNWDVFAEGKIQC